MNIVETITSRLEKHELETIIREKVAKDHPKYKVKSITFDIYPQSNIGIGGNLVVNNGGMYPVSSSYFTGVSLVLELKPA